MSLMKRWDEYLGPKDERLEAESARYLRIGYYLLLAGVVLCIYYGVMLEQVSYVTEVPLLTAAGAEVVFPNALLVGALLVACFVPLALQARCGIVSDRARFAQVDSVPWDLVLLTSLACGAVVAVLSVVMRVLAEMQIVGVGSVAWGGDVAIGIVCFGLAFMLAMAFSASLFRDAIKNRRRLEDELDD
ncbi:hypothetical protein [Enterorhabdus sp. P55]|uniref:hypothetical protein n=1 Tax=Enterorhabdus sp. P55 TaxID=2304571 RepID=UPI0013708367|nr:hypothetical protein [Enterorhabdus sp. P55]NBI31560.1 hypothetical protein [Enterorhabdus sp. P55]